MVEHLPTASGIYIITNLVNGKVYVGQAKGCKGILQRCRGHLCALRHNKDSAHLQKAWNVYGEEAFSFEILMLCSAETCDQWENHFLGVLQSWDPIKGYNLYRKASGKGRASEDSKRKSSEAQKGKPRRSGWNHTQEVKERISRKKIGRVFSEEHKRKLSEARKGKKSNFAGHKHSQSSKEKMSQIKKSHELPGE